MTFIVLTGYSVLTIPLILSTAEPNTVAGKRPRADVELQMIRTKRILWGEPLLDPNSYSVMRFIVEINNGRCYAQRRDTWLIPVFCKETEGYHMCGGSLIAEYVVQTACHCIARFYKESGSSMRTSREDVWENPYGLHTGHYDIHQEVKTGGRPLQFLHHQKCKMWGDRISYDVGIIISNSPLIKDKSIGTAPVYPVSELKRMYNKIQDEERVCLLNGWGEYKLINNKTKGVNSRYLQHTWNRVMAYEECYKSFESFIDFIRDHRSLKLNYAELNTWFCAKHFGKMVGHIGYCDSGSPITCGDTYTGLVSAAKDVYRLEKREYVTLKSTFSSLSFAEQENAAEYRKAFLTGTIRAILESSGIQHEYEMRKVACSIKAQPAILGAVIFVNVIMPR